MQDAHPAEALGLHGDVESSGDRLLFFQLPGVLPLQPGALSASEPAPSQQSPLQALADGLVSTACCWAIVLWSCPLVWISGSLFWSAHRAAAVGCHLVQLPHMVTSDEPKTRAAPISNAAVVSLLHVLVSRCRA